MKKIRLLLNLLVAISMVTALTGCAEEIESGIPMPTQKFEVETDPHPEEEPRKELEEETQQEPQETVSVEGELPEGVATRFERAIDGDTIDTAAGRIRIIGIDTPERGQCGYQRAKKEINKLLRHGETIYIDLPKGQNGVDKYDRLIRYVYTNDGTDIGLMQLEFGHAVARYDSFDGYPRHPKQHEYHAAQVASYASNGDVRPTYCPDVQAVPVPENPDFGDGWWRDYRSCSALKKNTVGHTKGPFDVNNPAELEIYNWFAYGTGYNGDGDWDGLACE